MHMAKMSDAELMKQVRNLAASNSKSGVARELNMSVQTFTNRLLAAASSLGEAPPKFTRKSSAAKAVKPKRIHTDKVRSAGQAGKALRIIIPQQFFSSLDWKAGDEIRMRKSGKTKIIIEKN